MFIQIHSLLDYIYCKRRFYLSYMDNCEETNEYMRSGTNHHLKSAAQPNTTRKSKDISHQVLHEVMVCSNKLKIYGIVDVLTILKDCSDNITEITVTERKNLSGNHKVTNETLGQLCAYTLCVEEMYPNIPIHAKVYSYTHRKTYDITITGELRNLVLSSIEGCREMLNDRTKAHSLFKDKKAKFKSHKCDKCAYKYECHPKLRSKVSQDWFNNQIEKRIVG